MDEESSLCYCAGRIPRSIDVDGQDREKTAERQEGHLREGRRRTLSSPIWTRAMVGHRYRVESEQAKSGSDNGNIQASPKLTTVINWDALDSLAIGERVVGSLSEALKQADRDALGRIFLSKGSYWRDTLSITSHLRTFKDSGT
jgi:hypothetical protein